ncbi:phosphotransferase enzyme family protein [Geodermatophilus sp. SYSU D00705]
MTLLTDPVLDRAGQALPLAELADLWPLGGWRTVSPVPGGKNEHLRVVARDGVHYLRRSYRSKSRDELTGQLALMRLLRHRGFPAPEVVPTRTGLDHVELAGRLWITTRGVEGTPFDDTSPAHLRALGRTVGRYHGIVADLPAEVDDPPVLAELRRRLDEPGLDAGLRARAERVVRRLTALLPELPRVVVHGGARRGSLVFAGDQVVGVLDFDSAHPDVRALDLAVAVHDAGKVYTRLGDHDHKVALDLSRVAALLTSYGQQVRLTPAEAEAVPLLLEGKRLKRGLGRRVRVGAGEPLSANDHAKIRLEDSRLAWLDAHRDDLVAVCRSVSA